MNRATHVFGWDLGKFHAITPLDDRPTAAPQPHTHIDALVHAHLPRVDHQHTVTHTRDMRRAVDMARDNETAVDVVDGETSEGMREAPLVGFTAGSLVGCRRHRHVEDAAAQLGDAASGGSAGGGGREQDVHTGVAADVDVAGGAEGGPVDAEAGAGGHFGVVVSAGGVGEGGKGAEAVAVLGGGGAGGDSWGAVAPAGTDGGVRVLAVAGNGGK